jgi:hypothetical protein
MYRSEGRSIVFMDDTFRHGSRSVPFSWGDVPITGQTTESVIVSYCYVAVYNDVQSCPTDFNLVTSKLSEGT